MDEENKEFDVETDIDIEGERIVIKFSRPLTSVVLSLDQVAALQNVFKRLSRQILNQDKNQN